MSDAQGNPAHDSALEAAVEQFELDWLAGKRPRIEEFLAADVASRDKLLWELIHAELEFRLKAGETARVEEYLARFPQLGSTPTELAKLVRSEYELARRLNPQVTVQEYFDRFPALAGQLKEAWPAPVPRRTALRLNCPHCQNPIEIVANEPSKELVCPSCGSSFHIDQDRTHTWNPERLPKLGKFELLQSVGSGAFGTVYRARDTQLDRIVAVKLPRSGALGSNADEDRFIRDARNAGQLRHPGIVPVFEVGRSETFPYIVMEFVDGTTLADVLTSRRLSVRESAELLVKVAEALEHAHQKGVIHRDLKPSNIMLSADGMPRLMDFGLAKRDAGEITMTMDGQILGTPAYMSPEQAKGEAHSADARSDVYSLGVMLYQLLTGELPFRGNTRMLIQQVLNDEPRSLRKLNDRIPRDLETICLKAMAKEPSRRYATSQEFADDLSRYLKGDPIHARPVGRIERAWKWCKTNRAVATAAAAVCILLSSVATVASVAALLVNTAREKADDKAAEAVAAANSLRRINYAVSINSAQAAWEAGNIERVTELLMQTAPKSGEIDLRGWEWWHQKRRSNRALRTIKVDGIRGLVFLNDGRSLVTPVHDTVVRWSVETGSVMRALKSEVQPFVAVAATPSRTRIAWSNMHGPIDIWDAESGDIVQTIDGRLEGAEYPAELAISPDGKFIAAAAALIESRFHVDAWDIETGLKLWSVEGPFAKCLAFSSDGKHLAVTSENSVKLLAADSGVPVAVLDGHTDNVTTVAYSPDGRWIATGSYDHTIKLWDAETGHEVRTLNGHTGWVNTLAFSPDCRYIASGSNDKIIRIWNSETGSVHDTLLGHTFHVDTISFSPDGNNIASADRDGNVKIWDLTTSADSRVFDGGLGRTEPLYDTYCLPEISRDGHYLAYAGAQNSIKVWNLSTGQALQTLTGHSDEIYQVAFSPNGRLLASTSKDDTTRIWDLETSDLAHQILTFRGGVVSFSDDSRRILCLRESSFEGCEIGSDQNWISSENVIRDSAAFSHEVRCILEERDNHLQLRDNGTGKTLQTFAHKPAAALKCIACSYDGRQLAWGDYTGMIIISSIKTGALLNTCKGHASAVEWIAFSPDGQRLVSVGEDRTIRLWDTESGLQLQTLSTDEGVPKRATFSFDGKCLAFASDTGVVTLWETLLLSEGEKTARWVADRLFQETSDWGEVARSIKMKADWPESMRQAAIAYVEDAIRWQPQSDSNEKRPEDESANSGTEAMPGGKVESGEITNSIGVKLVLIPAGEFQMGASPDDEEARDDEKPRHQVRITKPFYMGTYEVTVGQFRQFVDSTDYKTDAEKDGEGGINYKRWEYAPLRDPDVTWRDNGFDQTIDHPVVNVSWYDASAFCKWLSEKEGHNYRLPTEAEWEYACRAKSTTRFIHGDDPEDLLRDDPRSLITVANVADESLRRLELIPELTIIDGSDGWPFTAPVGRFKPNAFGLYDMTGNAYEFCSDFLDSDYYEHSPVDDPQGAESSEWHVIRGGSWFTGRSAKLRITHRSDAMPTVRAADLGFRVVRNAQDAN